MSLSLRRAWIEIPTLRASVTVCQSSLSLRRAWIEMDGTYLTREQVRSLSLRRAWIEIKEAHMAEHAAPVALLTESVD